MTRNDDLGFHADSISNSPYLKQADLFIGGKWLEVTVEIVRVVRHTIEAASWRKNDKPQNGALVYFRDKDKPLFIKKENKERLKSLYGVNTKDWVGKKITIYADLTVKFGKETTGGLRVKAPPAAQRQAVVHPEQQSPSPTPQATPPPQAAPSRPTVPTATLALTPQATPAPATPMQTELGGREPGEDDDA